MIQSWQLRDISDDECLRLCNAANFPEPLFSKMNSDSVLTLIRNYPTSVLLIPLPCLLPPHPGGCTDIICLAQTVPHLQSGFAKPLIDWLRFCKAQISR